MKNKGYYVYWMIALSIICYGVYHLWLGAMFCEPNAEDFSLSIAPRDMGVFPSVINLLTFFDSRYTANFLHAVNVLVYNRYDLFYLMPISCLFFLWLSFYFFLGGLFQTTEKKLVLLLFAALFVIVYYATMPSLVFGLYYMASTFTYVYPWIFWFIWVGCVLRSFESEGFGYIFLTIVGLSTLFLSFGSSELFIVINGITLFVFFLFTIQTKRSNFFTALPYFLVSLGSLLFIISCPSAKFIGEKFHPDISEPTNWANVFSQSIRMNFTFIKKVVLSPMVICIGIANIFFLSQLTRKRYLENLLSKKTLILTLIVLCLIAYACSLPYFIALKKSTEFPLRIFDTTFVIWLLAFFLILPLLVLQAIQSFLQKTEIQYLSIVFIGCILISLFIFPNNFKLVRSEYLGGILQTVKCSHENFYQAVDKSKKTGNKPTIVYFQNPIHPPVSIYFGPDLMPNRSSENWNIAYENYFGVDEVRLPGDSIFKK